MKKSKPVPRPNPWIKETMQPKIMKQANEMSHDDVIRHPDGKLYRIMGIHQKCVAAKLIEASDGVMATRWLYYSSFHQYELKGRDTLPQYMEALVFPPSSPRAKCGDCGKGADCTCSQQSWDREYPVTPAPTFYITKRHSSDLKAGERFKFGVGRLQRHRVVAVEPDVLVYRDPEGRLQEVPHCMMYCIELLEGE